MQPTAIKMVGMTTFLVLFAPFVCAILLVWFLSRQIVSRADEGRQAREGEGGRIEFTPNPRSYWSVYAFVALLLYVALSQMITGHGSITAVITAVVCVGLDLLVLAAYPSEIVVDANGITQIYWLWWNKRIAWNEIASVKADEKKGTLTILGKGGTKITHTRQLPDRTRFEAEVETHSPGMIPAASSMVAVSASGSPTTLK